MRRDELSGCRFLGTISRLMPRSETGEALNSMSGLCRSKSQHFNSWQTTNNCNSMDNRLADTVCSRWVCTTVRCWCEWVAATVLRKCVATAAIMTVRLGPPRVCRHHRQQPYAATENTRMQVTNPHPRCGRQALQRRRGSPRFYVSSAGTTPTLAQRQHKGANSPQHLLCYCYCKSERLKAATPLPSTVRAPMRVERRRLAGHGRAADFTRLRYPRQGYWQWEMFLYRTRYVSETAGIHSSGQLRAARMGENKVCAVAYRFPSSRAKAARKSSNAPRPVGLCRSCRRQAKAVEYERGLVGRYVQDCAASGVVSHQSEVGPLAQLGLLPRLRWHLELLCIMYN